MRTYQVVEHGAPSSLEGGRIDNLVAGAGQILVEVRAAGINFPYVLVVWGGGDTPVLKVNYLLPQEYQHHRNSVERLS